MLRVAVSLLLALASALGAQERAPVVSARIGPEAPAIGEPITVELRVRAPAGAEVRFPALPDSVEGIEPLDPRAIRDESTRERVDRTAVYKLIAWDTGLRTPRFGDITVVVDGAEQAYPVTLPALRIRSVLPADSTKRIPRPPRAAIDIAREWWRWIVGGVVVLGLLLWWWRVRQARRARIVAAPDAAKVAEEAFTYAGNSGLLDAGEHGRYALSHIAILRTYLAARFPQAHPSLTAEEIPTVLRGSEFPVLPERVGELLARAEPIAYAQAPLSLEEARELGLEARKVVRDVETALHARRVHATPKKGKKVAPPRGAKERA